VTALGVLLLVVVVVALVDAVVTRAIAEHVHRALDDGCPCPICQQPRRKP
jgi:hypothetical protein